ncbi:hypothetical protein [Hymenobacter sp. 102]|uniref:hypothetical protein n=1 Tax=Hymenobacter sp. 102 TaxID=3403152 RepID=UPI003CFA348D
MRAPLPPVRLVSPPWVRTTTGSGAFAAMSASDSTLPPALPPADEPASHWPAPPAPPQPPPPPEQFTELRSEDGRVALTNTGLELREELFGWRELEGVEVRPVRWLLGVLLGIFVLGTFLLGYLQFWLRMVPAALGVGAGLALLAWGVRGTNRWRVYRPGREPYHVALSGPAASWAGLALEANRRIRQRHDEAAAAAAYALALADWQAAARPPALLP